MNALEYQQYRAEKYAAAALGTLRRALYDREGVDETEFQIGRGLKAWVVQRTSTWRAPESVVVFGKSPSDAKRRACAPARLAEGCAGDVDTVYRIESGWDEPLVWPVPA